MTELILTILPERPDDAQAIERLHERTFGPGRFVLSAYRLREDIGHDLKLSFTAFIGTLLIGSVPQLPRAKSRAGQAPGTNEFEGDGIIGAGL